MYKAAIKAGKKKQQHKIMLSHIQKENKVDQEIKWFAQIHSVI